MQNENNENILCYKLNGKKKLYYIVNVEPFALWIKSGIIGHAGFMCAMFDGTTLKQVQVGKRKTDVRIFVNIDWAINDWGCKEDWITELKLFKEKMIKNLPDLIASECGEFNEKF